MTGQPTADLLQSLSQEDRLRDLLFKSLDRERLLKQRILDLQDQLTRTQRLAGAIQQESAAAMGIK